MGAGDFKQDDFSDEERAALGEVEEGKAKVEEPEKPAPEAEGSVKTADSTEVKTEDEKPEPTEEEKAAMSAAGVKLIEENGRQYLLDEDGEKIPVERWKKFFSKTKQEKETIENKHNLLKQLGADEYYRIYPDEKPAGYQPEVKPEPASAATEDFNAMVVNGGKYDGLTIGEVAMQDPVSATLMVNNYLDSKRQAVEQESKKHEKFQNDFATERNAFCLGRAKEMFGKEKDFTPVEIEQVNSEYKKLSDFMITQNIAHYRMEDAYLLMNKDKIIHSEKVKVAKAAISEATKKGVASIGNGDSNAGLSGFDSYLSMSEDALLKTIDKWSDKDQMKFYKDAPKAMRDKYPSLPW